MLSVRNALSTSSLLRAEPGVGGGEEAGNPVCREFAF